MRRETLLQKLRDLMLRMHRDESGAIVILSFAACLFLFMVSLIIYDAGQLSRDKIDVQMAADTAGYSQAAVKARAMNMVAFANVGKRTISGIRNMYILQPGAYVMWYSGQCNRCCCGLICGCWDACLNCLGNTISMVPFFEGFEGAMFIAMRYFGGDDITAHLEALDTYQQEMGRYAPYWALGEGIIRGVRNGAHIVTTYPMPDTDTYGGLPLDKDDSPAGALESCLLPFSVGNPVSLGTMAEFFVNYKELERRSVSRPPPALEGPAERANPWLAIGGCLMSATFPDEGPLSAPYFLSAAGNSGEDYMKKSNLVWTYRYNPDLQGMLRTNYDAVLPQDYADPGIMALPQGGLWSMARGEIYYDSDNDPSIMSGNHGMWMFHPGWIGKLRPVVLKGESLPVDPSDMWSEARGLAMREAPLFGVGMGDLSRDLMFMEKATRGMDGQIQGREVLDGISK